jgi:hypothetical protein
VLRIECDKCGRSGKCRLGAEGGISRSSPLLFWLLSGYTTQPDADPRRTEPHRNEVPWPGIITHRSTHGSVNRHLQKPSFGKWPTRPWRAGINRSPERQPRTTAARVAVIRKQSPRIGRGAPAAALASEGPKDRRAGTARQAPLSLLAAPPGRKICAFPQQLPDEHLRA